MRNTLLSTMLILAITIPSFGNDTFESIPDTSQQLSGYERDSVTNRLRALPLHDIEGLWQWVEDGAIIAIERDFINEAITRYRMVIVESPQRSIRPGTVMGYLTTTAKRGNFDARIYTDNDLTGLLSKTKSFNIVMSDDTHFSITSYREGISVNLWRLIPYMYRINISTKSNRPQGLDGCIKIFPPSTSKPQNPRYL